MKVTTYNSLAADGTPVSGYSTRTIEERDARAWPTSITTASYTGGAWLDYRTDTYSCDLYGQINEVQAKDLISNRTRTILQQSWDGRELVSRTDEEGVTTTYSYFSGTNILHHTRREAIAAQGTYPAQPAITATYSGSYTVNASERPVWKHKTTTITAGDITQVMHDTYDERDRIVSHTDADGLTTTTDYSHNDLVTTETLPSGATSITAKDSQGRILCVTGTAVVAKYYRYQILTSGNEKVTTYTGTCNGPRYQIEEPDSTGRIVRTASPAFGGGTKESNFTYDTTHPHGVSQITRSGQATIIQELNSVGANERLGLTADDASLALASDTDRIVDTVMTDEFVDGSLWHVIRTRIRPESGSAVPKLISTPRSKLAGYTGTEIFRGESIDSTGNTTGAYTDLSGTVREKHVSRPGITGEIITTYHAGNLVSQLLPGDSAPYDYGNDALGRQISSKSPRHTSAATTTYSSTGNQIDNVTNAAGNTISYIYYPQGSVGAGRIKTITLPDSTTQYYIYTSRGELKASWGSQLNPTWNEYDAFGQFIILHTWQTAPTLNIASPPSSPPADSAITSWNYEAATGLLTSKRDATGLGADYEYDAAGRLTKRTWARTQSGVRLATVYTPNAFNEITNIDYADDTPDVTIVYDRLGRKSTVTQSNQSKITYSYDSTNLALDTETVKYDLDHDGTYDFTRVLDRSRDTLNRNSGWQLKDGTTLENQVTYGYSATDGRLTTVVGGGDTSSPQTFSYGYTPDSGLIQTVTGPIHTVTNVWETNREVLDVKQNKVGDDDISKFDYAVNTIGQRTGVSTSGTAFPATLSWDWGYDSLGQLTSADSSVNSSDRAYKYDAIGNRKKSANSLTLPTSANYVANSLNQYTTGTTATAVPEYDADGNATAYPLPYAPTTNGILSWDASNRMISSTVGSINTTYLYDAQSRCIAKTTGGTSTLYVYDGFNCIAEYSWSMSSPTTLQKSRLWGLDLSDSIQGVGGVGGLLSESQLITSNSTAYNTFFPTYDGNGNISEYVAANGSITAHFEYDPYGNIIVNTDTNNHFAYRFSTKSLDFVTGLYYYTYRWYDPLSGRWSSRDPIEENGGVNLYGFAGNDGVNHVDFIGLKGIEVNLSVYDTQTSDPLNLWFAKLYDKNPELIKDFSDISSIANKKCTDGNCLKNLVIMSHGAGAGMLNIGGTTYSGYKNYPAPFKMGAGQSLSTGNNMADLMAYNNMVREIERENNQLKLSLENLGKVKWCENCSIILSGCSAATGDMAMMTLLAKATKCRVIGTNVPNQFQSDTAGTYSWLMQGQFIRVFGDGNDYDSISKSASGETHAFDNKTNQGSGFFPDAYTAPGNNDTGPVPNIPGEPPKVPGIR